MSEISVVAPLRVIDHDVAGPVRPDDLAKLSAPLTSMLTSELDEAQRYLGVTTDELLIAALSRAVARTIGNGDAYVDDGRGRPIPLTCSSSRGTDATEVLLSVRRALAAVHHRSVDGAWPRADVFFSRIDSGSGSTFGDLPPADMLSERGYALAVGVYRTGDLLHMDWWYDSRRLDQGTVAELTEQFPLALIELTSEASPPSRRDAPLAMI